VGRVNVLKTSQSNIDEHLYPVRKEYEQIVITAPGPKTLSKSEENIEEDEEDTLIIEGGESGKELYSAFNSAVLAFTRALVRARVEPIHMKLNVDNGEQEGDRVVLSALLDSDVEVKIEASLSKIKYLIVFPKHDKKSRRIARKLENALLNVLQEPLTA